MVQMVVWGGIGLKSDFQYSDPCYSGFVICQKDGRWEVVAVKHCFSITFLSDLQEKRNRPILYSHIQIIQVAIF